MALLYRARTTQNTVCQCVSHKVTEPTRDTRPPPPEPRAPTELPDTAHARARVVCESVSGVCVWRDGGRRRDTAHARLDDDIL